jgi:hypothetical protein
MTAGRQVIPYTCAAHGVPHRLLAVPSARPSARPRRSRCGIESGRLSLSKSASPSPGVLDELRSPTLRTRMANERARCLLYLYGADVAGSWPRWPSRRTAHRSISASDAHDSSFSGRVRSVQIHSSAAFIPRGLLNRAVHVDLAPPGPSRGRPLSSGGVPFCRARGRAGHPVMMTARRL